MIKKDIYKAIGDHLMATLKNLTGLPDLAWYDKQMGQFSQPELAYVVPLPAVLIEFGQFTWTTEGANTQKGEGIIRFYVYFENYSNSFNGALDQELALRYFEFTEAVHQALQGFSTTDVMPLQRVTDGEDVDQDMIITNIVEYSTTIFDRATNRKRNFTDVDPDVQVDYKKTSSRPVPTPGGDYIV
ncbi:MAG: hypothetical protein IE931_05615 [Sphingobacteriales bacterium]|nr:hypothetical protein [Sphingobacteriales bacterium]